MRPLKVATRKSRLALAQTRALVRDLQAIHPGLCVEEVHVTTTGDRIQDRALSQIGGKGLFLKEIEEALVRGDADIAVHSMKDVPAELAPGLVLGCVPPRADVRDVFISRDGCPFLELPAGSRVGTSSLRRSVQLSRMRGDVEFIPFRGNVDTRLRKLSEGVADGTLLARCGLQRLGVWPEIHAETLEPEACLPAVGQGALAVEIREGDEEVAQCLEPLSHEETNIRVAAERGVMTAVSGSCQIPVAAYAVRSAEDMWLRAFLAEPDGTRPRTREVRGPWPTTVDEARLLGLSLGKQLASGPLE